MRDLGWLRTFGATATLALVGVAGCAPPLPTADEFGAIDALIDELEDPAAPGGIVGVFQGGELVYQRAYGLARIDGEVPIEPHTPMDIGSISKQITAMALHLLAEDGEIDLDDDVRDYVPELGDFGEPIRVHQLLTHTSGLRDFYNAFLAKGYGMDETISLEEFMAWVGRQDTLNFPVGEGFSYSNTGYDLAAIIVERVSGQSFDAFASERIFEPLGMEDTRFLTEPHEATDDAAWSYAEDADGWELVLNDTLLLGAGGVATTPSDFARWMANLQDNRLRGGDQLIEALTEVPEGSEADYAHGIFVFRDEDGVLEWNHGGGWKGFVSHASLWPELDMGYVIFTNDGGATIGQLQGEIHDILLDRADLPEAGTEPEADASEEPVESTWEPEDLDDYLGEYPLGDMPASLEFKIIDDQLHGQATGQGAFPLAPIAEDRFEFPPAGIEVQFERDEDDLVVAMTLFQGGGEFRGERGAVSTIDDATIAGVIGEYRSEELDATYLVERDGDDLTLKIDDRFEAPLTLVGREAATFVNGIPIVVGLRWEGDRVIGLSVSVGGRAQNMLFERVIRP